MAHEEIGQHVVAEVVRIHRPAQLVRDAPEGVAQLLLVGVGHYLRVWMPVVSAPFTSQR